MKYDYDRYKKELSKLKGESKQVDPRDLKNLIEDCGGKLGVGGRNQKGDCMVEISDAQTGSYLGRFNFGPDTVENVKKITKGR